MSSESYLVLQLLRQMQHFQHHHQSTVLQMNHDCFKNLKALLSIIEVSKHTTE